MLESIAIIEDNLDYAEILGAVLTSLAGDQLKIHRASNITNGTKLVEQILNREVRVNAILMDRNLGSNGDEGDILANKLREGGFQGIIIGISDNVIQKDLPAIIQNGTHIPKTISPYTDATDIYSFLTDTSVA